MAPTPGNHIEGASAVVNGKLYLLGGFSSYSGTLYPTNRIDVYNPVTNIWESIASPRSPIPLLMSHMWAAVDGQYIWLVGGFVGPDPGVPTNQVWRYDTVADVWSAGPNLPAPRASGGAVILDRILHYFGGVTVDRQINQAEHWTLDLDNPVSWGTAAPMTRPRNHFQATTIDGLIYAAGGQWGHDGTNYDVNWLDVYNPATDTWQTRANLPQARSHYESATFVYNERIIVTSGKARPANPTAISNVTQYNPQTNTWTELRPLPLPLYEVSANVIGDRMIVTAGGRSWNNFQQTTYVSQITDTCIHNRPPVGVGDSYSVNEGGTLNIAAAGILSNDSDPDGDALTASLVSGVSKGALTLNANGSFSYTHNGSETLNDSFTYQVRDGNGGTAQATVQITVVPVNDPPLAVADSYTVTQGGSLTIIPSGVLANDTDPENDILTAIVVANPTSGTLALNANGSFTYVHGGISTTDSFTYEARDPSGSGSQALVTITINQKPIAVDDSYTVAEGGTLNQGGSGVLGNDSDPENNALTANLLTGPSNGTVTLNANGRFIYTHNGSETITDSFTYQVTDSYGGTAQATVNLTVASVNDAPAAVADTYIVAEGGTLNIAAPGVLSNDTDPESDPLSGVLFSGATRGVVTLLADGSFSYVHDGSETTSDSFTYRVSDGNGGLAIGTVNLTITPVNDPPSATDDTYYVTEGATLNIPVSGILANDTDPENNALTATLITPPIQGNLTLNTDGSFNYVNNSALSNSDSFIYQVADGNGGTSQAVVTIFINAQPITGLDSYSVAEGGTLNITSPGVLGNDTDPDGDPLSATIISGPTNGTLTLNANGGFSYTHNGSETTTDSFIYQANDGKGATAQGSVTITITPVNDPPVAISNTYTLAEGDTLTISAPGVLGNDSDPENDTLFAVIFGGVTHGNLSLNADGSFTYTHDGSETTTDSFIYRVSDGNGGTAQATVTLTITPMNDAPVGTDDAYTVNQGATLTLTAPGILANDTDAENNPLTALVITAPLNGTLTLNANGSFTYVHNGSINVQDVFTYMVQDGQGGSAQATVRLAINNKPIANPNSYTVAEGATLTITAPGVLANDTDAENDPLTAYLISQPVHGTLTLNANGSFTYVHDGSEITNDSFAYEVRDSAGAAAQTTVTLAITPVNDAPIAMNDTYTVAEGATLTIAAPGLLANDTDAENDTLTATRVTLPAHGTVIVNADGSFTYTHDGSETTSDSFAYRVSDGKGGTAQAAVNLTITPTNDAPVGVDDIYRVTQGTTLSITQAAGVLVNDTDVENNPLTAQIVTAPVNGTLTLNANGSFTYVHGGGTNGPDSFVYEANDGQGGTAQATVTVEVNRLPIVANDTYTVAEGGQLNVTSAQGVLKNDSDPDGDLLTVSVITQPVNGTLTLNANGSFTYLHNGSETTTDSFSYQADDGGGGTTQGVVTLTITPVNDAPIAVNDTYTVAEGSTLTIAAPGLLTNDIDAENDPLTAVRITLPIHGTVTVNADGGFTYTHDGSETTSDSFTYRVSDGKGGTAQATVNLTITPVNDPPVGVDDTFGINQGETLTIPAPGVLGNDSDVENNPLTVQVVTVPINGTLNLNADGSLTYIHDGSVNVQDEFTYEVQDGQGGTAQAVVRLEINNKPIGNPDSYTVAEGATRIVNAATGVLANDTDVEHDPLTAQVMSAPLNGTLTLNPNGAFTYLHNGSETTGDSFTYEVRDSRGGTAQGVVTLTITPVNDAPIAVNDTYTVAEGSTLTIAAPGLLTNDIDAENDPLTAVRITLPIHGTVTVNADGGFTYTHDGGETTNDSFTYRVSDGKGGTAQATVNLTITPVNDPPVSVDDTFGINQGETLTIPAPGVLGNDSDVENNPLTVQVVTAPINGTLNLNADGSLTYIHDGSVNVQDEFTYEVQDGQGGTAQAMVYLEVNNKPVAGNDSYTTAEGATLAVGGPLGVLRNDTDIENDPLTAQLLTAPINGTLTLNANGSFSYTHDSSETTSDSFTYEVRDSKGGTAQAVVTLTITPVNDPPTIQADNYTLAEGETLQVDALLGILANDTDVEGDLLSVQLITAPVNGTLTLNADGSFVYVHDGSEVTNDTFIYEAADSHRGISQTVVTLTITPVNDNPVAVGKTYTVIEGSTLTLGGPGLLENAYDPEHDLLTAMMVTPPVFGNLTLQPDGSFTYVHQGNSLATDTFIYGIEDGNGGTAQAVITLQIAVNPAAAAAIDLEITPIEQTVTAAQTAVFTVAVTNTGNANFDTVDILGGSLADCTRNLGPMTSGSRVVFSCLQTGISASALETVTVEATNASEVVSATDSVWIKFLNASTPALFDPPFGEKRLNAQNIAEFEWGFFWVNPNTDPLRTRVTDQIPAGLSYVPGSLTCATNAGGTLITLQCEVIGQQVIWEGVIFPDSGAQLGGQAAQYNNPLIVTFRTTVPSGLNEVRNQAQANYDSNGDNVPDRLVNSNIVVWQGDTVSGEQVGQAVELVTPTAEQAGLGDLLITQIVTPAFALPGQLLTFNILIQNIGNADLNDISVSDILPVEFALQSAQASSGQTIVDGQTMRLLIDLLRAGDSVTLTLVVRVEDQLSTLLVENVACATANGVEVCAKSPIAGVSLLPNTGESPWSGWRGWFVFGLSLAYGIRQLYRRRRTMFLLK